MQLKISSLLPLFTIILHVSATDRANEGYLKVLLTLNDLANHKIGNCYKDLKSVMELVMLEDESAIQMLESWSAFPSNLTHGNTYDFGNFDLCANLKVDNVMTTQYCQIQYYYKSLPIVRVEPHDSFMNLHWRKIGERFGGAICLPESCNDSDVRTIMSGLFKGSQLKQADDYDQANFCKRKSDDFQLNYWMEIVLIIHLFFYPIMGIATFYDHYYMPKDSMNDVSSKQSNFTSFIISAFSIKRNYRDLFDFSREKSTITCLNGIKAICIGTIMFYHSMQLRLQFPFSDGSQLSYWTSGTFMKFVGPMTIPVDAFFLMSGALVTRSVLKDLERGKFSFMKIYVQRYFRITPTCIIVIIIHSLMSAVHYHNAPYSFKNNLSEGCTNHWLATILHIQIYNNPHEMCAPHTWYLDVDWHMFLIAPFLIIVAWKFPFRKLISASFVVLVAIFIAAKYYTIIENNFTFEDLSVYHHIKAPIEFLIYYPTHIRGLPFLIGMMLGYFLRDEKYIIGNEALTKLIMQFSLLLAILFIFIYPIPLEYLSTLISSQFEIFFMTFGKLFWSIALSVVIFACHHRYGGIFNYLLSLKIWIPLARMGLSFYLIFTGIQFIFITGLKEPQSMRNGFDILRFYLMDILISTPPVIVIYFMIEAPFTHIGKKIASNLSWIC